LRPIVDDAFALSVASGALLCGAALHDLMMVCYPLEK
jgi:hypothetical protein